jgi:hypothetical protein
MKNGARKKTLKRKNGRKTKVMDTFVFFLYLECFNHFLHHFFGFIFITY